MTATAFILEPLHNGEVLITDGPSDALATVHAYRGAAKRDEIARLIAAAPEMLAALQLALQHVPAGAMSYSKGTYGDRVYPMEVVKAAIDKATGA